MENRAEFLTAVWAGQRSGLYYTAVSTRLTAAELGYILADSGSAAVIASPSLADRVDAAIVDAPEVRRRWLIGGAKDGWDSYEKILATSSPGEVPHAVEGNDFLYSSGTTGRPKGVKWPLSGAPVGTPVPLLGFIQNLYGFDENSIYLSPAPLYHAAPIRFCVCVHRGGGTVVVMEHFDAEDLLRFIEHYRITHVQVVPTMFVRLLKLPAEVRNRYDLSSLRTVVHAAAPCPRQVKLDMIDWWGPIIYEYYSATEGNGFTACDSEEWLAHPGTVGRALQGIAHIVDDQDKELPSGQIGAVYFEGGGQFDYHQDPDKTHSAYNYRGWSTIGDIGYLDDEGFLYLTDRKSFTIISGGVNIYPQEAENLLLEHESVLDAAVIGVPDEDLGEAVKAVVQLVAGVPADASTEQSLLRYCREHLADYKCPKTIDFRDELPRHATGKLYKSKLREEYQGAAGLR